MRGLLALTATFGLLSPVAWAGPLTAYQFDLGPQPATVSGAEMSRVLRENTAVRVAACGQEVAFLDAVRKKDSDEDMAKYLVAKVAWLRLGKGSCEAKIDLPATVDAGHFNAEYTARFGTDCAEPVTFVTREPPSGLEEEERKACLARGEPSCDAPDHIRATFVVSNLCLKRQVNMAIAAMAVNGQPGTDKIPCHLTDKAHGDWDVTVRDLVRIYHLSKDATNAPGAEILEPATREHLFGDLLTISGPLWPDDYPFGGCGDTERETGSPADRADERSWGEDTFGWLADAWDVLKWFLLAILIIVIIVVALALLFAALGAGAAFSVAATVGVLLGAGALLGAVALSTARIPETENHLLMINTSRFLINDMIIADDPHDVHFYVDDQVKVKRWLLERLQRIATHDFDEYNARPYQRYSILALLNLYDFVKCDLRRTAGANDCDLKVAVQIVLDLATAKFVAGSIDGRRSAPFRRLMDVVADDAIQRHRFTDASHGSDYMFGFMLGYTGQTSQLPERKAEMGAINEMVYPATSRYTPAPAVLSVAMGELGAFEQTIHHDGYEIYSRSPSFLVSAGGVQTASATPAKLGFINVGARCVDRGAGLPTVLIPGSTGHVPTNPAVVRDDLLRIEGFYHHYQREQLICSGGDRANDRPADLAANTWSHDDNLCVYKGFACGTNMVVPPVLEPCFTPAIGNWRFLSSTSCPALAGTGPFYVALWRRSCPPEANNCLRDWGFFEAVEAPTGSGDAEYAAYRGRVIGANSALDNAILPSGKAPRLGGRYFSPNGHVISFDAAATMNDKSRGGVEAVNGLHLPTLEGWPLASGGVINASKCPKEDLFGKIEISGKGTGVTIDFCDATKPSWRAH